MTDLIMPRRNFLRGLGSLLIAAPAIVHAGNLMPVKSIARLMVSDLDVTMNILDCGSVSLWRVSWQEHWEQLAEEIMPRAARNPTPIITPFKV